jgi:hypothetical protein
MPVCDFSMRRMIRDQLAQIPVVIVQEGFIPYR